MEQDDLKEKLKMDFPTPENRFNETLARCKKKHHRIRYFGLALSIVIVCALLVIIPVIFSNNKSSIASAKQGIINMYKDEEVNTTGSFERLTSYGGYKLTWSVIGNEDNVVLEEVDDKVIVKINNNNDEDISYQLKVVITNDEESEEIVWNYVIPKMEREILIARFCDVEVFDLEELDKYVRFNSYYIYTIAELNTSNWIPSFNLVMIPFEGFDPIVLTDLKQSDNNDIYYFNYFILITNDIVNNEVVFCDCEINDVSILVVYDNIDKDKAEFYQEYPVQTSDYITYKKVEKDLSKIGRGVVYKYILNEATKEPVIDMVYPFNLLYAKEDDVVDKVKEFVNTKKVNSSNLSIIDYFKNVLHKKPNAFLRIEVKATIIIDDEKIEKTFFVDAFIDKELN